MLHATLILSVVCFAFIQTTRAQITVERTPRSFMIRTTGPDTCTSLTFRSEITDGKYDLLRIGNAHHQTLEEQIPCIARLWQFSTDSIPIALRSVGVDYPLSYSDVLKAQVEAFKHQRNTRHMSPKKIREVMMKARVPQTGMYRLSLARQTLVLLISIISIHCASTVPHNTIMIPCPIEASTALNEAQQYLARLGFQQKVFLPDSGYFRTKALKAGSVATTASGKPSWYVFEVIHRSKTLSVRAFNLIPMPNSEAMKFNTSPEDEAGTEENPVMPGDRFHMMIVEPFIDHMKQTCER